MATRRKDADLAGLAAKVEQAKAGDDSSGFISDGLIFSDFSVILAGCVDFDERLPESECLHIVQRVAHDHKLPRPITADVLLRACAKQEQAYLAKPIQSYRLLTEVSLWWTLTPPNTRLDDVSITFRPELAKAFTQRSTLTANAESLLGRRLPSGYMQMAAHLKARSAYEAAERGLKAIDLLRASWNLAINREKVWRETGGGRPSPVNDIQVTPFHTVHLSNGQLATEVFWYDPSYSKPANSFSDKKKFERVLSFTKKLRFRLASVPYKSELRDALIRYVRALDSADLGDAFLRLWSLLEFLTDSTHDPYKVTTRRAAFLFKDRERSNLVLSNLANYRNRFVHDGSQAEEIEPLVFQLKRYVDALLIFHVGNRFSFGTRAEAAHFMDLPPTAEELRRRRARLDQAIRYVSGGT